MTVIYLDQMAIVAEDKILRELKTIEEGLEGLNFAIRREDIIISSLSDERLTLKQPISIYIAKDNGGYIANYYDVEAVGFGDTVSEAINNLKENIIELYFDLVNDINNLGPLPKKWLVTLNEIISEK